VPVNGKLVPLGSWGVSGNATPFNPPGVGNNMLYVGDLNGVLHAYGVLTP
jgi:hypothetical protein